MGLRLGAGVALVCVALLGFTVAAPQDAKLGIGLELKDVIDPRGANVGDVKDGDIRADDLGKVLDRIDGRDLDPDLVRNLDPTALAGLLDGMTPDELAALGLDQAGAQDLIDRLRDPDLTEEELADIAAELSDRGLRFANDDADGRFDAGEAAYADLDGDGKVSEGDVRLGVLALLLGIDRGLSDEARTLLTAYELAGGLGLARPPSAATKASATAATAPLAANGYPTDRAMGPALVLCVQVYSPSLTCHTRTFVHAAIAERGDHALFRLAEGGKTTLRPVPAAAGPRAEGHVQVELRGSIWVPLAGLTPADVLVGTDRPDIELARDGNGMLWARAPGVHGLQHLNLTWAVDLGYYDLPVAADVTPEDVPLAQRPALDATSHAIGQHVADLAGAHGRTYGDAVRAVAAYVRGFGMGPLPDRDEQSNDFLAVAEAQVGCARHRAQLFVLAVQSLGIPARFVVNEGHAFAEVLVPEAGWHLVDVGACGRVQVRPLDGHEEVMARQDLPYAPDDAPPSQADAGAGPAQATIEITQWPPSLRVNQTFQIGGVLGSPDGPVPPGIPITFTYNRTKEQPGTPFCSTASAADHTFTGSCRLPAGMPPAPNTGWQLVARLAPSVVAGKPTAEAYSDPPFVVQKATRLAIEGHAKTSSDVPVAYTAHVLDEDGNPVAQRHVTLTVDGGDAVTRATDATGRARFTLTLPQGPHTLAASLPGDDEYDPSQGTLRVEATATRLGLQVDQATLDRGSLVVTGLAATGTTPAAGRTLTASWRNDPDGPAQEKAVTTGSNGRFTVRFDGLPRPGPGLATVVDEKAGVGVDIAYARTVEAFASLGVPDQWALGSPVPVDVAITGPPDPVPLRVTLDGLFVAEVDAGDRLPAHVLITVPAGVHTVGVEAGAGVRLTSQSARILVAPATVAFDPPGTQSPGSALTVTGTVRFDGLPVAAPLTLRLLGAEANASSASDGSFTLSLQVPADATPGNATAVLQVPHLGHSVEVPVRIQRPANIALEAPGVSFQAFGSTRITVRGEGAVTVYADGKAIGGAGDLELPTRTWFWRSIDLRVESAPASADVAPAAATATVQVYNPVMIGGVPLLAVALAIAALRTVRHVRARIAHRNRFLPPRPRSPIRVVQPAIPRRVPLAFDPAVDGTLVLRMPRAAPWTVATLAEGGAQAARFQSDGRTVRIDLRSLPLGPQVLRLHDGKEGRPPLRLAIAVQDLRSALDESTLAVLGRIGKASPWPAPLAALEAALREAGAAPPDAVAVRRQAEGSLYAVEAIARDRFHAFFETLDAAQARRPA